MAADAIADVVAVLPEIEEIHDTTLREQTAEALARCLARSNWSDADEMPFVLDIPASTFDAVQHVRAVVRVTRAVAEALGDSLGLEVDHDDLVAAALLHDASKWMEYSQTDDGPDYADVGRALPHAMYAAVAAADAGLPSHIVQAIACHTPQNTMPTTSAIAVVLHHVDLMITDCCRLSAGLGSRFKTVRLPAAES